MPGEPDGMSTLAILAAALALAGAVPQVGTNRPLVGAIRWDGWYGTERGQVCKVVTECLSPLRYRHRAPFFSKAIDKQRITIGPLTQAIMDREIAYARRAAIDYWAFVAYDEADPLADALKLYLASGHSADVRFAMLLEAGRTGNAEAFPGRMKRFINLMRRPNYVRVAGGRPLFFLGFVDEAYIASWGGLAQGRKLFDQFRADAIAAGAGDPYLVIMDFSPARGKQLADALGAQAVSAYVVPGNGGNRSPYSDLTRAAREYWEAAASLGAKVVPTAVTGWDRRPRIERPHPWEPWQKAGEGMERYFEAPTPAQLAAHIREAVAWVRDHPAACEAEALIVYAWNEHDEGGWICPTLGEGDVRVRALERASREAGPLR